MKIKNEQVKTWSKFRKKEEKSTKKNNKWMKKNNKKKDTRNIKSATDIFSLRVGF